MALEASQQLADVNRVIIGYTIRDVVFSSPLIISLDTEAVETEVYVRPLRDFSEKYSTRYEFNVLAYTNGYWNENCRGTVQVDYEPPVDEVDGGKEVDATSAHYYNLCEEGYLRCTRPLNNDLMYEKMKNIGLEYGPAFQSFEKLSCATDGRAVGSIKTFEWTADNQSHPQRHIIHPTTLDGLFQLMMPALSRGMETDIPTMMPTRVGKLWLSSRGISYPNIETVDAYVEAHLSSHRTANALLIAVDRTKKSFLLSVEDAKATAVATRDTTSKLENSAKRICYNVAWKPDLDLLDHQQLRAYCEEARPSRSPTEKFYNDLDLVLLMFMSNALVAYNNSMHSDVPLHLQRYIQWLQSQTSRFQTGSLPHRTSDDPTWKALSHDSVYFEQLRNSLELTNQGKFFIRIGRDLPKLLNGDLDPLTYMFEDDFVSHFYKELNRNIFCREPFNRYIKLICHKSPGLKILEIGAGTGGTTDLIIEALSACAQPSTESVGFVHYDYTDISHAFFESAKGKYEQYSDKMRFKVLDIEKDPFKQGFETGTYDIVFAACVLHATSNLETTIRNAHKLLKPGGKFIIWEITQDVIRARFGFGLLPGWWLSEEDYRQNGPCIGIAEWNRLLSQNGFSGIDLEIKEELKDECHEYSTFVSTAVNSCPVKEVVQPNWSKALIIITERGPNQLRMANELTDQMVSSQRLENCVIVTLREACSMDDLQTRFCFSILEVGKPFLSHISEDDFMWLRRTITTAPGILWITKGGDRQRNDPHFHIIDGLARVARTESNKLIFVTLALEDTSSASGKTVGKILQVYENMLSCQAFEDFEPEYVEEGGALEIGRIVKASYLNHDIQTRTSARRVKHQEFGSGPPLAITWSPGLLDSLYFSEDSKIAEPLAHGEIEIKVEATGINFRDCLTVLGQVDLSSLGAECAGTVSRAGEGCELQPGDRVTSILTATYATYARGSERCTMKIPDSMQFTEASALPIIFLTAWHSLCDVARLQRGESVLIHAGAGGTGQAAIQIAKYIEAEIYVTVGSADKKKLLMGLYHIPEDHIFYCRNTSFAQGIMRVTKTVVLMLSLTLCLGRV